MIDPYLYANSDVLKNKFNVKDHEMLMQIEKEYTTVRMNEIILDEENKLIKGNFEYEHFKLFHKYIFQDVYKWAGEQRTVDIEKSEIVLNGIDFKYSSIKNIEKEIKESLLELENTQWHKLNLDDKVSKFTYLLSNVWKAHAFREGNTRTTIFFFIKAAKYLNIPLKYEILTNNSDYLRKALVAASFEDKEIGINRNFTYLDRIIKDSFESYEQKDQEKKTMQDVKKNLADNKTDSISKKYKIINTNKER